MFAHRFLAAAVILVSATLAIGHATAVGIADDSRVFELRLYTAAPGKLDALDARFRDHAHGLFAKHRMTVVGYWLGTETPNTFVYMLAFKDRAERDAKWKEFTADPEWTKAQRESEPDGQRLIGQSQTIFLGATPYSPLK